MIDWPVWVLFPGILASVLALSATVIGSGWLAVLLLQPVLGTKALHWHADPVTVLGLPPDLMSKCESLGFWTCESMVDAIERGKFPWTALEYDERMQVERALSMWRAHKADRQQPVS